MRWKPPGALGMKDMPSVHDVKPSCCQACPAPSGHGREGPMWCLQRCKGQTCRLEAGNGSLMWFNSRGMLGN